MSTSTEIVVIGAGPGGYAAAFYAADRGLDVTLIDKDPALGGVCLNRGCIPSKLLLHLAAVIEETKEVREMGLDFGEPKLDLDKIRKFKEKVVGQLNSGLDHLAGKRKVNVIIGTARFTGQNSLVVDRGAREETVEFKHAVIAVGSRPAIPGPLKLDSPRIMDSTGALELEDIPEKLLVIGGGVIGLELGTVYASFGSEVTVVEALDQLATGVDRDLMRPLEKRLKKLMKEIHVSAKVKSLEEADGGKKILVKYETSDGEAREETFDRVLMSTGRRPNSENLGLDLAGITPDERGFIPVNRAMQTTTPHIYAIGDVIGHPMLAHKSSAEARVAVDKIRGKKAEADFMGIPSVIYTDPEVAWVGLTETEAKEKGIEYKIGKFPWSALGRALAINRTEGLTKILFHPKTERVLGVGIVGPHAGELIAEGGLALEMGAVMEDLAGTIHAHPTLSETMLESAEALHNLSTHIYGRPAKGS